MWGNKRRTGDKCMTVWESIKTAWRSIFANKLRSSLTMRGLMIGVGGCFVGVLGAGIAGQSYGNF